MQHPAMYLKMIVFVASMLAIVHSKLLQSPEDTEAVVGENVTLRCRTDVNDSIEWRYKNTPSSQFEIVYRKTNVFKERCKVVPNRSTGQHDLVIRRVQLSDAGRYTCGDRGAELIVFDKYPSHEFCTMTSNGNKNVCGAETVAISCDLSYRGNKVPTWEWLDGDNAIPSIVTNHTNGLIASSISLQKRQLETSKFTCRVRYPASTMTSRFIWSPTMNNTLESTSSLSHGGCDHETIECSDVKSPHCQYTWKDENGTEVSSSSSMQMAGKLNGNYTCFATCKVHQTSCSYAAKIFNYRCHEFSSSFGRSTSTIGLSHPETIAPPESMVSSPGLTSPKIYIPAAIAALVILIAISLLVARVFRRSFSASSDGTHDNQDKNGADAEMGQNNNNDNTKVTLLNGAKSQDLTMASQ